MLVGTKFDGEIVKVNMHVQHTIMDSPMLVRELKTLI